MADSQSSVAEDSQANSVASVRSASIAPNPIGRDTSSTQSHDKYEPLPPGCWTLDFHGNCPRCHHHHKALQVQVKVTSDASQVSYVRCERCQDKWAAFGGRNATRISLLSTTTNEPDSVERGVRYSLVEIVKLAQERASLGTLPEASSPVLSHQPPASAHKIAGSSPVFPSLDLSATGKEAEDAKLSEPGLYHHSLGPSVSYSTEHTIAPKSRSSTLRLLSKFKLKITTRFPMLNKGPGRRILGSYKQPNMSKRQIEKSPIQTPQTANPVPAPLPASMEQPLSSGKHEVASPRTYEVDIAEPSKRIAEVIAFVASLDKSALNLMSEQERSQWMRQEYTNFKARRKSSVAPLSLSGIVQTSIQSSPPRPFSSQLPVELLGIRGYSEDLEMVESIEAALRRGSLTISETSDVQSTSDDLTPFGSRRNSGQLRVMRWRQGLGRPQSLPSHLRPNALNSYDALVLGERHSNSSMRGQRPSSRLSQGTTMCTSTASTVRPESQGTLRPESRDGHNMESQGSTPSTQSTPQAPSDPPRQV
jgi:DNA-directed RNA polymerase subunit M/transcription elongation factor TFIIS